MKKDEITQGLLDIGACWAIRKDKFSCAGPCCRNKRPAYHIHPDASYPHEGSILRFDFLREIAGYIQARKRAQAWEEKAQAARASGNERDAEHYGRLSRQEIDDYYNSLQD